MSATSPIIVHFVQITSRRKRITSGERAWTAQGIEVVLEVSGGGRRRRRVPIAWEPVADIGGNISHGVHVENFVRFHDRCRTGKKKRERSK